MKFREVKHLTRAHTACERWSGDSNVGLPDSQPCSLALGEDGLTTATPRTQTSRPGALSGTLHVCIWPLEA